MVNDSSLGAGEMFNLDSQSEVMQLLVSVRASELTTAQKNELRDLVFLYINGGKDNSVRISLEQKVISYKIKKIPTSIPEPDVPPPLFGTYRPAPVFAAPVGVVPNAPVKLPDPVKVEVPTVAPIVVSQSIPPPPPPVTEEPKVVVAPVDVAVASPVPVSQPIAASIDSVPVDANKNLDRIREIKSLVNEKIGNPVNLVDINNEVGREYMSALLDAMKKVGNGSSAVSAMKRLEDAFALVEKTLEDYTRANSSVDEKVSAAQSSFVPPEPVPVPVPPQEPVQQQIVNNIPIEIKPSVETPDPIKFSESGEFAMPPVSSSAPVNLPIKNESVVEGDFPRAANVGSPIASDINSVPKTEIESNWGPATDTLAKDVPIYSPAGVVSLAQSKIKLRSPEDLPSSSAIETSSVAGDSLFTREVDDGLHQLLSEWSIFKKSGLFGTGPKGKDHPLYKKVSNLPIPLLLAGRFEGATQEIKQSVTDYMNGWRYEQGIIYEQGENFEHYLRRVIQHILDLQKRKRPS